MRPRCMKAPWPSSRSMPGARTSGGWSASDLNRLRTLRETETCPVVRLVQREGPVSAGRAALLREGVPCGKCSGALRSAFTFPFRDSFAGPSVADFYVFRLCRLII